MNEVSKSDDELLEGVFPALAKRIGSLRVVDNRLNELCDDFLVLQRNYTLAVQDHKNTDARYLADLTEGLEELRKEIEAHLRLTNATDRAVTGGLHYRKGTE